MIKRLFLLLIFICCTISELHAQRNNQFQIGNRLMQQHQYEEALRIFERISGQNPDVFLYFDRLIECHIQLKQYDEATKLVERNIRKNKNASLSRILLGELYHFKGDTARAFQEWEQNIADNPNQLQIYINTANTMLDRRAYRKAIAVYQLGRKNFGNSQLFMTDVPNAYMQAGEYDKAIAEWMQLIQENPNQSSGFQRLLLRYNDPILYEVSIIEIDELLTNLPLSDPAYEEFYGLQIWLLFEQKLYRRAYAAALEYENKTEEFNFRLFNVGRRLAENKQFELALSAFEYYTTNSFGEVKWRALEEKATTLTRWAKYLDDYSLDFAGQKDSLFHQAVILLDSVAAQTSTYSRMHQVFLKKAELALDFVHDLQSAEKAVSELKKIPGMSGAAESDYLDGRIFLAKHEYTSARISLTRANKEAEVGELAEKTRYFLALTDFYSGDFEFSKIQLKTLGRQNTSYYANDALELRLWVQEGLAADTTGTQLQLFADGVNEMNMGLDQQSAGTFLRLIDSYPKTPLYDDALLHLSKTSTFANTRFSDFYNQFITTSTSSPLREQLMWIRAKSSESGFTTNAPDSLSSGPQTFDISPAELYEQLILEYPQGFYAPYARKKLSELPKSNS